MDHNRKTSADFTPGEPPSGLAGIVVERIRREEEHRARRRVAMFSLGTALAGAGFLFAFRATTTELAQSGAGEYLSLFVSDAGVMVVSWQSFLFALLESIPVVSVIMLLAAAFVFIACAQWLARNMKTLQFTKHHYDGVF
ncbi:MAG: hypothetical protein AAB581_01485 [Patescibacteria group bacterium]